METGALADNSSSSSAAVMDRKPERPRANSSGSIDYRRSTPVTAGVGLSSVGKFMLQIPVGPQCRPRRLPSPGYRLQEHSSTDNAAVQLNKVHLFSLRLNYWLEMYNRELFYSRFKLQQRTPKVSVIHYSFNKLPFITFIIVIKRKYL